MCCTRKIIWRKKKIHRVYPKPPSPSFTADEVISCAGCNKAFPLSEIKINCAGCNQFYHCCIAGTCYGNKGKACLYKEDSEMTHNESWCIHCVPDIPENKIRKDRKDRKDPCICKKCYSSR